MKFFAKYVSSFDTLVVAFKTGTQTSTKKIDNIELIYADKELLGANIFAPKKDKTKNYGLESSELATYITNALSKVEKLSAFEPQFVVVEVKKCEKIEGTHLSLCEVFDGKTTIQVVCGAGNVKTGMFTCLATVGAFLPNGMMISKGSLKGFDSFGMLCSAKELGIENPKFDQPGIMDLKVKAFDCGKSIWQVVK